MVNGNSGRLGLVLPSAVGFEVVSPTDQSIRNCRLLGLCASFVRACITEDEPRTQEVAKSSRACFVRLELGSWPVHIHRELTAAGHFGMLFITMAASRAAGHRLAALSLLIATSLGQQLAACNRTCLFASSSYFGMCQSRTFKDRG